MVQRQAARYVRNRYHNTSSVTEMLHQLQWTSLEACRTRARLVLLYKISNNLVKTDPTSKLIPPKRLSRNMHDRSFQIPARSTTLRREFFIRGLYGNGIHCQPTLPLQGALKPSRSSSASWNK